MKKTWLAAAAAALFTCSSASFAQWAVFDVANYSQNLLTAARELQQIDNQIQQLQNEATMLTNQGRNLTSLNYNSLSQLLATLASTNQLIAQAQGLTFKVAQSQVTFDRLYPSSYSASTSHAQMVQDAQSRWRTSVQALQTATQMQSQAAQNLLSDQSVLSGLVTQSQGAVGALQASQATNQLLALIARQAIQAQQFTVSQDRAAALDQARGAADEAQAEQVRSRFIGNGPQYTPQPVNFYGN
ncbi:MAG: P-type conjugative transfer protein TrbJ [Mizugakiibacter sp.]|jgi:P-type conjugative transfer protein TrbJ|uniref:P-type conjugative transfer protein TrbJ n=1 Tax=Rhodanobacteraceae TaxID=1775411 RepID=UPI002966E8A4|nr:P-type conjugative transfer protein TrbJ [Rhodanobacter sp. KK11]MCE5232313.1 P-type conjugative transfer protein TrbJ [Xanthomonadaceae bacterium]MDW2982467.1 P-type conjugative transfer protein TrbJ [Rhodanobacter sp. KK11]